MITLIIQIFSKKKIFDNPNHKWTRTEQIKSCVEWGNPKVLWEINSNILILGMLFLEE